MPRLGPTVARLHALRRASMNAMSAMDALGSIADGGALAELEAFGSNPGALGARVHIPEDLPPGAPLVVVLHGCTQNASGYDQGSGWSQLADRHGFALLLPEQSRSNNPNLCFNWYRPGDMRRGRGEAASIAQMVRHLVASRDLDPSRVFINGLSAGGAMTAVMLACYPELFAGGAIIAGLAFGVADGVPAALERMRGSGMPPRAALARRIASAAPSPKRWPTLSVWHGTADSTVDNANADAIVDQWRDRTGLGDVQGEIGKVDGQRHTVWRDTHGRAMIERYDIAGMGHGTPLATRGEAACGKAGAHMLEAGICSTRRLAAFWGLSQAGETRGARPATPRPALAAKSPPRKRAAPPRATGVGAVIEDALRAAGLMR